MACARCNHKGYVEGFYHRDARAYPSVAQCPHCKDVAAYSDKVQEMMLGPITADEFPEPGSSYSDLVEQERERVNRAGLGLRITRPSDDKKDGEPCKVLHFRKG